MKQLIINIKQEYVNFDELLIKAMEDQKGWCSKQENM